MAINIAIDGPASAGKSTVARSLAKSLGYVYIDTGALYRALAYYAVCHDRNPACRSEVIPMLESVHLGFTKIDNEQQVVLNGTALGSEIRTPEVSMGASAISAIPEVRDFLLELQRDIAKRNNVVMDGRDIGTVVLPKADVKIFLTAEPAERARRRCAELRGNGVKTTYSEVLEDITARDYNDSHRLVAPLKQAPDAILYDTTYRNPKTVLNDISSIIMSRAGGAR